MFVSHQYKLIFLEVPRTGSRAISQALESFDPSSPTSIAREESSAADYHRFRCPEMNDPEYRVIATHRNPYDRLWSFWKHRRNTGNPPIFTSIDWPTYVAWVLDPDSVPELLGSMQDLPVSEMLPLDRVDYWLSFEDLEASWARLAEALELPLPALNRINASPDHGELANAYTLARAAQVYERFRKDFETFDYPEDSWHPNPADLPALASRQGQRPVVAILTTLGKPHEAYSVERVIRDQVSMLLLHGYEPVLLVAESKHWPADSGVYANPRIRLRPLKRVPNSNDHGEEEAFFADVAELKEQMLAALEGVDLVLTHDIVYLPMFLKQCIAARQVAGERPDIKWLHWIHSATTPMELKMEGIAEDLFGEVLKAPWPGSYPVYFNRKSVSRIATNFGYPPESVKIIPHPTDICDYLGLSDIVRRIYRDCELHAADYISVMPVRLDRGKQVEWVIRVLARLKAHGASVRVIIGDFHSQAEDKSAYREYLREQAWDWGLGPGELVFISELDESLKGEAPRSLLRELFSLANVFIQASRSESYSLVSQEAAISGNLLVLNDDFPPMREIFGEDALYCQFGSGLDRISLQDGTTLLQIEAVAVDSKPVGYPEALYQRGEDGWLVAGEAVHADMIARQIEHEFSHNKVLRQRQKRLRDRNLYSVFRRHLEPLLISVWRE